MGKEVRVNLNFDKSWLDKNSYKDDEPPMRLLVASVREEQQVKIITADYTTLIVKMEESFWESFAEWIENFVREYYDEENIWKYVQIDGGKKGWKPKQKTEEEQKQLAQQNKRKQLREELSGAGAFDDDLLAEITETAAEKEEDEEETWQEKKRSAESQMTVLLKEH